MTGMKKKIASLLLMLTLIMCQMPTLVFANDMPADVPPADQQEQTVGQDEQNDQNGQPAGGQMNLANAGDNEEGTDGQNGDDVSKEQTTGSDASGTDETNGGDSKDLSDEAAKGNTPATVPANAGKKMLNDTPMHTKAVNQIWVESKSGGTVNGSAPSGQQGDAVVFPVGEGGKTCVNNIESVHLQVGSIITLTAQPNSGYEFRGWSKNWNSSHPTFFDTNATINYTVAENQGDTLTAVFQTDSNTKYLCVGQSAGGSITATGDPSPYQGAVNFAYATGTEVTLVATPKENYRFAGWYEGVRGQSGFVESRTDTLYSTNATYTFTLNENKNVYAQYIETRTVSFDAQGGTPVPVAQVVDKGQKANKPDAPSKAGLHLLGWFTKTPDKLTSEDVHANNPPGFDFANTAINENTTLHAAWYADFEGATYDVTDSGNPVKYAGGNVKFTSIYQHPNYPVNGWSSYSNVQNSDITVTAIPDDDYVFVGWAKDSPTGTKVSTDKVYTFTFTGKTTLYALFEKRPPVLTLHWSSVDGKDLMDPVKISVPKGTTVNEALATKEWTLDTSVFTKDGYKDSKFRNKNPITNYTSEAEMQAGSVEGTTQINADTDIYYIMYKKIDKVSAGIESPVCGTETANGTQSVPYDQTNPPAVSVTSGKGYKLFMADSKPYAFWTVNGTETTPFVGMFKGDETYYARFRLLADFGYVFSERPTATLDNAEVTLVQVEDATNQKNLIVGGAVKADHNWGEWEVTKEPTETEEGLEERTCKTVDCGAHEERTIPKLVVEYRFVSGDGSSWTRGSTEKLNFVVKRNRADETTVDHFKGLKVDGKEVPSSGYAAKAGSVVIDLMPAYLGTLADGDHTLTAVFDDGNKETSASFKVLSAADKGSKDKANSNKKGSPATGDEAQLLIWLMILCTAGLALSDRIIRRLREQAVRR